MIVKTFDELNDAFESSLNRSHTDIVVGESINFEGRTLGHGPPTSNSVRISGGGPGITLTGDKWWTDWSHGKVEQSMINFSHVGVTLSDLTVENYSWPGCAVKVDSSEMARIGNVTFRNIGQHAYAPSVPYPTDSSQMIMTQCVGGWTPQSRVSVSGCKFEDCVRGNEWSHCIYLVAKYVQVTGCTFNRCGQELSLPRCDEIYVVGNRSTECMPTMARWKYLNNPMWLHFQGTKRITARDNVIDGVRSIVYYGNVPTGSVFSGNDYSRLKLGRNEPYPLCWWDGSDKGRQTFNEWIEAHGG